MSVDFRQISAGHIRAYTEDRSKKLCDIYDMGGWWKPWINLCSCNAEFLRAIADKLDELNGVTK